MSTTSTQYLVYASLLLGSIGTYHALKDATGPSLDSEIAISDALSGGASATPALLDLSRKVDANASKSTGLSDRLLEIESWVQTRKAASRNVPIDAGSSEVSQAVYDRLADLESLTDTNKLRLETTRTDVDINTGDISEYALSFQEQISTNKSNISAVKLTADTNLDTLTNVLAPRVDAVEGDIINLRDSLDTEITVKIDQNGADIETAAGARQIITDSVEEVSKRVTENTQDITDIEDALEGVYTEAIDNNKANIQAVADDLGNLSEKLMRSGDKIVCSGLLQARQGADIYLKGNQMRLGEGPNFMMYMGDGNAEKGPSGSSPAKGWGFAAHAFRCRVPDNAVNGFIVENSNEVPLFSIRGSDGIAQFKSVLRVDETCRVFSSGDWACFANNSSGNLESCAVAQHNNGTTLVRSNTVVKLQAESSTVATATKGKFQVDNELVVNHRSGVHDTHFRENNNYISTGAGKRTYFRFGSGSSTVSIRNKEIEIDGTDVLAKLNSLETRIKQLEDKAVMHGSYLNLKSSINDKFLYADGSDRVAKAKGSHSYQAEAIFRVNLR